MNIMTVISKAKREKLLNDMSKFGVKEDDITEKFIRAGGPGGQKVNKTSSCVYLKHGPTGIEVKCSAARLRSVNRFIARRILVEKIEELLLEEKSRKRQAIEKKRRQKRKRSKRAKEKVLQNKRIQSQKKAMRSRIEPAE